MALLLAATLSVPLLAACALPQPEPGARQQEESACVVSPPGKAVPCTMEYAPVCGCNGKTYSNACTARAAGVPHSVPGACDASDRL